MLRSVYSALVCLAFLLLCGGGSASDVRWPTGAMPKVLLSSPVNLTWAANQGSYWRGKGIDGFLLRGIADDLNTVQRDGDDASLLPLLEELRLARTRLEDAGVSRFFIQMDMGPEAAWFTDRDRQAAAREAIGRAGAICQRSGMTGLALDLRPCPALFFPQWDGYPETPYEQLADETRAFARDLLRAFYRACPEGNVIVLCPSPIGAGPLFFRFVEGLLESVGAATSLKQRFIFPQPAPGETPEVFAAIQTLMHDQFLDAVQGVWESSGEMGFSVYPLTRDTGGVANRMTAEEFAERKAFLQLYSDALVIVDDPEGAWWSVAGHDAEQFSALRQAGPATVSASLPLPDWAAKWTCQLPFQDLVRFGGLDLDSGTVQVLQSALGAAAFFPHGTAKILTIPDRTQPLYVSRATGGFSTRDIAPARDGVVALPIFTEAVLVDGLPIREWLLPASLHFAVAHPFHAQSARPDSTVRNTARFGIRNPSPVLLEGQLEVIAGAGYSVGAATVDIKLPVGERRDYERHIQGVPRLGDTAKFDVVWRASEGSPTVKRCLYPVRPAVASTTRMFGPVDLSPVLLPDAQDKSTRIVVASTMGDVQGIRTDQHDGWVFTNRFLDIVAIQPFPISETATGVAMLDAVGRIRFLTAQGEALASLRVPEFDSAKALAVQEYGDDLTAFVVINNVGETVAIKSDGIVLWRAPALSFTEATSRIGLLPLPESGVLCHATGERGTIQCLGPDGMVAFSHNLALSAPPVLREGDNATVFLGLADGQVLEMRARDGRILGVAAACDQPVQWVCPLQDGRILVGLADKIALHDTKGDEVWTVAVANATPPDIVSVRNRSALLYGTDDGPYHGAIEARELRDGSLWWRDDAWPAPFHAPPRWVDVDNDGWPEAVVCGTDRRVRVLDLRQAWRAREDRPVH